MFESYKELPNGYELKDTLDLKNNKSAFFVLNIGSMALFVVVMFIWVFLFGALSFSDPIAMFVLLGLFILNIIIHEWIHGIFFKIGHSDKVTFKFHGFAASASIPDRYFSKKHYLLVGIAPFIFLMILYSLFALFAYQYFSASYQFVSAVLIAIHISGCIGDFYVCLKLLKKNESTLVQDYGIGMRFYSNENA